MVCPAKLLKELHFGFLGKTTMGREEASLEPAGLLGGQKALGPVVGTKFDSSSIDQSLLSGDDKVRVGPFVTLTRSGGFPYPSGFFSEINNSASSGRSRLGFVNKGTFMNRPTDKPNAMERSENMKKYDPTRSEVIRTKALKKFPLFLSLVTLIFGLAVILYSVLEH